MDWMQEIDGYCERLSPDYWAEPINAVTNAAFLIAAWIMWRRVRGQEMPLAMVLIALLAIIGIGSFLFHTHAQVWAAIADTTPIALFILVYIFAVNRDVWRMSPAYALGGTMLFFPYVIATIPLFRLVPGLGGSAGYAPVPLLILIYALLLRNREPQVAREMSIGALILISSIAFRALDAPICGQFSMGTHFIWHILNAITLGWMIEVYRRVVLRKRAADSLISKLQTGGVRGLRS
ncbi:ceramidase domain-containing protein [Rhodobacteraceae bacterium B1Z28]|uniref:Ceramidase domain-containing protein n=1 Tax=Ruegeria haliotis TaxID=2747601 RepID=A0ABX2PKB5_9RHOB|nr:ceramidase domain-containing protein [Ruegeria haliotis]NVO54468.1 ceramidase domain-containing protein [Ruegeria haliotis]